MIRYQADTLSFDESQENEIQQISLYRIPMEDVLKRKDFKQIKIEDDSQLDLLKISFVDASNGLLEFYNELDKSSFEESDLLVANTEIPFRTLRGGSMEILKLSFKNDRTDSFDTIQLMRVSDNTIILNQDTLKRFN